MGRIFFPSPGFPTKVQGKGEQSTSGGCNNVLIFFVRREDVWHMIPGDNPAGPDFVLRDSVLIELFQVSHNCVIELRLQTKFLLKLI